MSHSSESQKTDYPINDLETVSEFREDRLAITFTPSPHRERELMVNLAGSWIGISLLRQTRDGLHPQETVWWVMGMPHLGSFRVRGEAVFAAIHTTFDSDNDEPVSADAGGARP